MTEFVGLKTKEELQAMSPFVRLTELFGQNYDTSVYGPIAGETISQKVSKDLAQFSGAQYLTLAYLLTISPDFNHFYSLYLDNNTLKQSDKEIMKHSHKSLKVDQSKVIAAATKTRPNPAATPEEIDSQLDSVVILTHQSFTFQALEFLNTFLGINEPFFNQDVNFDSIKRNDDGSLKITCKMKEGRSCSYIEISDSDINGLLYSFKERINSDHSMQSSLQNAVKYLLNPGFFYMADFTRVHHDASKRGDNPHQAVKPVIEYYAGQLQDQFGIPKDLIVKETYTH